MDEALTLLNKMAACITSRANFGNVFSLREYFQTFKTIYIES